ncbi:hypothetical protein [Moorena sp. SIO3B2]|uniref:hypothetical protein n=1 Tax=Moorena sp. SIO3B2 TaxID=2607827 RepID=UPI0013CC49B8|nr:hypothetical protein [Moorena sp. SIO3B2]NEP35260.1 hypothetical protein [Moorena sp. SIO3B2]
MSLLFSPETKPAFGVKEPGAAWVFFASDCAIVCILPKSRSGDETLEERSFYG